MKSCKGCQSRTVEPNCHMTCEIYMEYVREHRLEMEEAQKDSIFNKYYHERREKILKKIHFW